jgi:mono/diheme cytochrome c family protein
MVKLPTLLAIALLPGLWPFSGAKAQEMTASAEEFRNSCASCHGDDGKGAGFLVKLFRGIDPGDLTQLTKNNDGVFPFVKVFQTIDGRSQIPAHGDREMPIWGDRYEVQLGDQYGPYGSEVFVRARVLELVYYIQSIQE